MVSKFYIYKGRRWVELDTVTGKLDGVQEKPRFLYMSNGTLQVAKSAKVLRGLQALAAGQKSTVTTGLSLIQKRKRKRRSRKCRRSNEPRHPHCNCRYNDNNESCQQKEAVTIKKITDAVTQTSVTNNAKPVEIKESEIQQEPENPVENDTAQKQQKTKNPTPIEADVKIINPEKTETVHREIFLEVEDVINMKRFLAKNPQFLGEFDEKQFDNDEAYRNDILFKLNPLVYVKKKISDLKAFVIKSEALDVKQFAAMLGLTHVTDKVTNSYAYKTRQKVDEIIANKKRLIPNSSSDEDAIRIAKDLSKPAKSMYRSTSEDSDSSLCLNLSPARRRLSDRLTRSKTAVSGDSFSDRGARKRSRISVTRNSDDSPKPKRRMVESDSTDAEKDNKRRETANSMKSTPKNHSTPMPKAKDKTLSTNTNRKSTKKDIVDLTRDSISESGDNESSDNDFLKKTISKSVKRIKTRDFKKKILPIPTKQKLNLLNRFSSKLRPRPQLNTSAKFAPYSSLEDHAIVAFIGVGGRDRQVNGNRVWKELQESYQGITGTERTWHSLRNRYLRHILPSLASLCLDPSLQTKLRAGAAKGELKLSRKRSLNKDNSFLKLPPVLSAWNRRPRTPVKMHNSPQKRPNSPQKRPNSPQKRPNSPQKRPNSPQKRPNSPQKRLISPQKRPNSPQKRPNSPNSSPNSPNSSQKSSYSSQKSSNSSQKRTDSNKIDAPEKRESTRIRFNEKNDKESPTREEREARKLRSSDAGNNKSPSYADLTKRFAEKHRYSGSGSSNNSLKMDVSEKDSTRKHGRRLFNPRAI